MLKAEVSTTEDMPGIKMTKVVSYSLPVTVCQASSVNFFDNFHSEHLRVLTSVLISD